MIFKGRITWYANCPQVLFKTTMLNNLRYSIRQLAKAPGFTFAAIITITLGIGANTAVFSIMNAVLLRLLPVPNPQELVLFHLRNQPHERIPVWIQRPIFVFAGL